MKKELDYNLDDLDLIFEEEQVSHDDEYSIDQQLSDYYKGISPLKTILIMRLISTNFRS